MTTSLARPVVQRLVAPVLLVLATLVGLLAPVQAAGAVRPPSVLETEFLQQLNAERSARGLAPLVLDPQLVDGSRNWANAMASSGRLVHSNDGRAEIIAYGYRTGQITLTWMQSAGHRNLIVDPNLVYAGFGVACDSSGRMWAAVQYRRVDTSLGTLTRSDPSPAVTAGDSGSDCKDQSGQPPVRRLYLAFFLRDSDSSGLNYWVQQYRGGRSLADIADFFAGSDEFRTRYGSLSDRDFVRQVYLNVLGRPPDSNGYGYWTGRLRSGTTRGQMMVGFSESPEFAVQSGII